MMKKPIISLVVIALSITACTQNTSPNNNSNNTIHMNETTNKNQTDHSNKSILARGCDPVMSLNASKSIPALIGNPEYIPTTDDADFVEKLKSRKWSVIFFAPGACRFSAAKQSIPGGNSFTEGWTLEQYRELVYKLQGEDVQIVETMDERETVTLLKSALDSSRENK